MVHQFDDRMYANCMQQQQPQHRQSLSASLSYLVTRPPVPRSTGAVDYGMYPGSGHTACSDDVITGRLATSICHQQQAVSYVNDAPPTNHHLHHQSSSSLHHQHQQHYTDYERHQMNSKCLRLGSGEDRQTSTCWTSAYPSLTADVHDSPAAWPATIGRAYDNYMSTDDSLDMLHHQLLNQDCRTSPSDNDFIYHQTVLSDNSATAPVTMTTDPTLKYRLQPKPDTADAVSVVKQHLMDLESRPHHVQTSESAWMQPEAAFGWMKKQDISPITLTGKTRTKEKYRIVYTEQQKIELEKEFLFNQYITIQRKAELAGSIGLSDRQVKIWFQNRRAKERKSRRKHVDQGTEVDSTGRGVASGAPAAMGVAKAAPAGEQLQAPHFTQPQYRDSDVIKLESCSHDNVTSSTPQHTPWL